MKKIISVILVLTLLLALVACTERKVPEETVVKPPEVEESPAKDSPEEEAPKEVAIPADGTYEGEAEGFNSNTPIKVSVTVEGGAITNVEVLDHEESDGIADPALEQVPAAIVKANSVNVDAVAGATYTSGGIVNAVVNALESAPEASSETSQLELVDGTYEGQAEGFHSTTPIKVSVTVEGGAITSVEVLDHEESDGIADPALEQVPAAIVESNSSDVDAVAGATYTSQGIMDAVKNALE